MSICREMYLLQIKANCPSPILTFKCSVEALVVRSSPTHRLEPPTPTTVLAEELEGQIELFQLRGLGFAGGTK